MDIAVFRYLSFPLRSAPFARPSTSRPVGAGSGHSAVGGGGHGQATGGPFMSNDRAALEELFRASTPGSCAVVLHYLYFPTKRRSRRGRRGASSHRVCTEERLGADGVNWLVLSKHEIIPSEETVEPRAR